MENSEIGKYTRSFGLSFAITSVVSALLVIIKESSEEGVLAAMKAVTGHHWITHGLINDQSYPFCGHWLGFNKEQQWSGSGNKCQRSCVMYIGRRHNQRGTHRRLLFFALVRRVFFPFKKTFIMRLFLETGRLKFPIDAIRHWVLSRTMSSKMSLTGTIMALTAPRPSADTYSLRNMRSSTRSPGARR